MRFGAASDVGSFDVAFFPKLSTFCVSGVTQSRSWVVEDTGDLHGSDTLDSEMDALLVSGESMVLVALEPSCSGAVSGASQASLWKIRRSRRIMGGMSRVISLPCGCGHVQQFDYTEELFSVDCDGCGEQLTFQGEGSFRLESDEEAIVLSFETHEVGRSGPNRIVIPNQRISRHHSTLRFVGSGYTIADRGSSNGTFVNGKRLAPNNPVRLRPGDVVRFWKIEFEYWAPVEMVDPAVSHARDRYRVKTRRSSWPLVGGLAGIAGLALAAFLLLFSSEEEKDVAGEEFELEPMTPPTVVEVRESLVVREDLPELIEADQEESSREFDAGGDRESSFVDSTLSPEKEATPEDESPPVRLSRGPNRLFEFSMRVDLDGERLDKSDRGTWVRLAYFLQHESETSYSLIFPDGKVPLVQRAGSKGELEVPKRNPFEGGDVSGDTSAPRYRVRIRAKSSFGDDITFRGQEVMRKCKCVLECKIDERVADGHKRLKYWKVEEKMTPVASKDLDEASIVRQTYDLAFEALMDRFREFPLFRVGLERP